MQKVGDGASIVLMGSFNPGIFHPAWFEKFELLPATETADAQVEVISNDVALFTMAWVRIEVLGERFVAKTADESKYGPLRDLVVGTFRILEHTPTYQLGMNRELQFQVPTEETWHKIGHQLAPKEHWLKYLKTPGMKSLVMESIRDDERPGVFNFTIRPVLHDPAKPRVVHISVNDHVELGKESTALDACKIIDEDWEGSMARAISIAEGLIMDTAK